MPELPEVESVRRSLARGIIGWRVVRAEAHRPGVITGPREPRSMLLGARIARVERRGKSLALVAHDARALAVHLGMSGRLLLTSDADDPPHTHAAWRLAPPHGSAARRTRLLFIDPRRFGGLWTYPSFDDLARDRWAPLGPDALAVDTDTLERRLRDTRRPLKAALLDQSLLAGLGNIYTDESLFRARLHPRRPADSLSRTELVALARCIRAILRDALRAGGSTLADGQYVDSNGDDGAYQRRHLVYGRAGLPCASCRRLLDHAILASRTTVFCPTCQPLTPPPPVRVHAGVLAV